MNKILYDPMTDFATLAWLAASRVLKFLSLMLDYFYTAVSVGLVIGLVLALVAAWYGYEAHLHQRRNARRKSYPPPKRRH